LGDVIQIFGIESHILEKSPGGFNDSEVIFGLMLLALEQPLLPPDAPERLIRNLQPIVALDALCAPGGEIFFP